LLWGSTSLGDKAQHTFDVVQGRTDGVIGVVEDDVIVGSRQIGMRREPCNMSWITDEAIQHAHPPHMLGLDEREDLFDDRDIASMRVAVCITL